MKKLLIVLATAVLLAVITAPAAAYVVVKPVYNPESSGSMFFGVLGEVAGPLEDANGNPMYYWLDYPWGSDWLLTSYDWWEGTALPLESSSPYGVYHLDTFWPQGGGNANPGYLPEDITYTCEPGYDYYTSINPVVDKFHPIWNEV